MGGFVTTIGCSTSDGSGNGRVSKMSSEILHDVRRILGARDDVELGILFGSTARGSARPSSDIDLAVLGKNADLMGISASLSRELGRDVQLTRASRCSSRYR